MFYSLAHPQLLDLLAEAEELLAVTGKAVELCPTHGIAAAGPRTAGGSRA